MKLGESAEETAIQEIKEEIGLDVETLEYIQSYPCDKKEMLMLGFLAKVKKADFVISQQVDAIEWVSLVLGRTYYTAFFASNGTQWLEGKPLCKSISKRGTRLGASSTLE